MRDIHVYMNYFDTECDTLPLTKVSFLLLDDPMNFKLESVPFSGR